MYPVMILLLFQNLPEHSVFELSTYSYSRSLKVTDFDTDRKPVCDVLLVNNTITYVLSRTVSELRGLLVKLSLLTGE